MSVFHWCDKILERNNFSEEKIILAHGFRAFSPWSIGFIAFGPVVRRYTLVSQNWKCSLDLLYYYIINFLY
jgi:hypothetical protein